MLARHDGTETSGRILALSQFIFMMMAKSSGCGMTLFIRYIVQETEYFFWS
jgi:hypothetical protein